MSGAAKQSTGPRYSAHYWFVIHSLAVGIDVSESGTSTSSVGGVATIKLALNFHANYVHMHPKTMSEDHE